MFIEFGWVESRDGIIRLRGQQVAARTAFRPRKIKGRSAVHRAIREARPPILVEGTICQPDQPLRAVEMRLIESKTGFLLLQERADGPLVGILTLHDILRAQQAAAEGGYSYPT